MAHVFLDHALLGELKRSGCTPVQTYLVQRVIRGISGTSLLSHHVSAAAPMTAELPRFSTALASSLSHGQPNTTLLGKLCSGATHAVDRAVAQWGTASALRKVRHALGQAAATLGDINKLSPGKRRADAAQRRVLSTAAADITAASPAVRQLIEERFRKVWKQAHAAPPALDLLADELACLMAAVDRDPDVLHRDLLRGMRSSKVPDGSAILSLLLPPESLHRVALVVHGARDLERLEAFDPSAVVSGLRRSELPGTSDANAVVSSLRHPEKLGFGHATDHLPWLVRQLNGTGPACLVSCEVSAVDVASAGRHARRHVSELLDQYMAGHRLVDLRLGEEVLVLPQGAMRAKHLSSRRPALNTAVPLTRDWPQPLRNTLRMAHVARTTSSPLPAAALAWSALEACELARKTQELARALSLQTMRQQIVEVYRQLGQAATAAERGARDAMASASKAAQSLARAAGKCDPDKAAYPDLRRRADQADDRHLVARGRHRALQALFDDRLTAVERHVKRTEADRLDDINAWVDLLLPGTPADTPETVDARDALNEVAAEVSALPAFQVTEWSTRLADPRACADWLVDRQDRIATLLSALYSARNLSLHAGQFRAVDDLTLATGGSLLVDVTLEVLGNWYRNAGTTRPQTAPEIISRLAKRQQHLVEDLRGGGAVLRDLDVALLTSPTPSGRWPHR